MGQKDLTAKELESRPDVFADIINSLIYRGKQVVLPEVLQPAPTETLYADVIDRTDGDKRSEVVAKEKLYGTLRNQYNDVSKYEIVRCEEKENEYRRKPRDRTDSAIGQKIRIQYILENESRENYRLLLRKAGYEGAIYRNEYEEKQIYPVVILVLYWGEKEWNPHTNLHELFADNLADEEIAEYVDNIRLHIFPMAHLPKEIRQRFKSDMRIVVDYLAEGDSYKPTEQVVKHVGAVTRLLYALTGERELQGILADMQYKQEKGEEIIMGEYYTTYFAKKCRQEGIQQGMDRLTNLIRMLLEKGREEDMRRSLEDKEYQERLFREFDL